MVEVYCNEAGDWRFRVKGGNGEIVAAGEGYTTRHDALRGYETLVRIVTDPDTRITEL